MSAGAIIWLASPVVAYLTVVVFGAVWFRGTRASCLPRTWLLSSLRAWSRTSSYLDFGGPALLGFFFLIPGTLVHMFSDPNILLFNLQATALYHVLPIAGGFFIAYFLLWAINRFRHRAANQSV